MDKNLRISFIAYTVLTSVVLAFLTCCRFFNGAAFAYVAVLISLAIIVYYFVCNSFVRSRFRDLFITAIVFAVLELVTFIVFEFPTSISASVYKGFWNYQVVVSCLGLLFLVYGVFRFIYETKNLKFGFIETILGNKRVIRKAKQAKEFTNGSLEAKPNRKHVDTVSEIPHEEIETKQQEQTQSLPTDTPEEN